MAIQKVHVASTQAMDSAILGYLNQGYIVADKSPTSATLQKKKEFSILWAVIGFIFCLLPLLIYMIYYVMQPDVQIVEITVVGVPGTS